MQACWDAAEVRELCSAHPGLDPDTALRIHGTRLLGREADLGTVGMGSASVKLESGARSAVLLVTARGAELAVLGPADLCALDLAAVRELCREREAQNPLERALRLALLDPDGPLPSPVAALHAAVPAACVDQTHPSALLALACQPDAEARLRSLLGARVGWVPWHSCMRAAASAVARACEKQPDLEALVVQGRGLLSFGSDPRESVEHAMDIARRAEAAVQECMPVGRMLDARPVVAMREVGEIAPLLRGALAMPTGDLDRPFAHLILEFRISEEIASFASAPVGALLAAATPPCEAHAQLGGGAWLLVASPPYADLQRLREVLCSEVEMQRRAWISRMERGIEDGPGPAREIDPFDPTPRVLLLPGVGLFGAGQTREQARAVALAAEHAIRVKIRAASVGQYEGLPEPAALLMGPARLTESDGTRLIGQVALVAGATELGRAAARALRAAGAAVIAVDRDAERMEGAFSDLAGVERIESDLADALDARNAVRCVAERTGGFDLLVADVDALGPQLTSDLVEQSLLSLSGQGNGGSITLITRDADASELCRSAALRGAAANVCVNALVLGAAPPRNLLRMPITPEHAARTAVFLAERSAPITGQVLRIDGGSGG